MLQDYHHALLNFTENHNDQTTAELERAQNQVDIHNAWQLNQQVEEVLSRMKLDGDADYASLSGGMKRRLGIAHALIGDPKIIVVDEPTTGLDPEERIRFSNILSELSQKDVIIILSTHIVGDISSICKDLALLNKGKVGFKGSPEELIKKTKGHVWQVTTSGFEYEMLKEKYAIISTIPSEEGWEVQLVGDTLNVKNAIEIEPNLEHAYVYFMEYLTDQNSF